MVKEEIGGRQEVGEEEEEGRRSWKNEEEMMDVILCLKEGESLAVDILSSRGRHKSTPRLILIFPV